MLKKISSYRYQLTLVVIFFLLLVTRFLGNHYDAGLHLHPDERWLIMVAGKIHLFNKLDPDFFAYGSLPIYVLKALAQSFDKLFLTKLDNYDGLLSLGRVIVSLLDILTAGLVFLIAKNLTHKKLTPYFALIFYALMFFPIQNSNFFIVDNFLNLFLTLVIFLSFRYLKKPSWLTFVLLAVASAAMLATKVTPVITLPIIFGIILLKLTTTATTKKLKIYHLILGLGLLGIFGFVSFFLFMPYGILHYHQFIQEVSHQIKMGKDPYVFPYTLQYVDTTAYLYYLKNIFLWGAGPVISLWSLVGLGVIIKKLVTQFKQRNSLTSFITQPLLLVTLVYAVYFLVVGKTAVKFMRYMLVVYPFIALSAGLAIEWFLTQVKLSFKLKRIIVILSLVLASIWLAAFLKIYLYPHTRIQATEWILKHIPTGSTLAVEHWDDRLPLYQAGKYQYVELPLYEPESQYKWLTVSQRLDQADYIIIASKRLYAPLTKLKDCKKYKKCYPETAKYYQDLFSGKLNFYKVAEFDFQPRLNFGLVKLKLDDNGADESFSVYDHPHVIIFKKNESRQLPQQP